MNNQETANMSLRNFPYPYQMAMGNFPAGPFPCQYSENLSIPSAPPIKKIIYKEVDCQTELSGSEFISCFSRCQQKIATSMDSSFNKLHPKTQKSNCSTLDTYSIVSSEKIKVDKLEKNCSTSDSTKTTDFDADSNKNLIFQDTNYKIEKNFQVSDTRGTSMNKSRLDFDLKNLKPRIVNKIKKKLGQKIRFYHCEVCDHNTGRCFRDLQRHMQVHVNKEFVCEIEKCPGQICGYSYDHKISLKKHQTMTHGYTVVGETTLPNRPKKSEPQTLKTLKRSRTDVSLNQTKLVPEIEDSNENLLAGSPESKKFRKKSSPVEINGPVCGVRQTHQSNLNQHMTVHENKKFKCDLEWNGSIGLGGGSNFYTCCRQVRYSCYFLRTNPSFASALTLTIQCLD